MVNFGENIPIQQFVHVDSWVPEPGDEYFKHTKNYIVLDLIDLFGLVVDEKNLNYFNLKRKRSYDSDDMRQHCTKYLNYFLKYYDRDKELISIYYYMKVCMDYYGPGTPYGYNETYFRHDIRRYFLQGSSLFYKFGFMNNDNYLLDLNYSNKNSTSLQYTNRHARILMKCSLIMNAIIPLCTHFIKIANIENSTEFLLSIYDEVLHMYDSVDIYNKFYETAISNVLKSAEHHELLWSMQDIRGNNVTTHAISCVHNIILNIMPKYTYEKNIIYFNYMSIHHNTGYQVIDIGYEYHFISLSSSKRDEDNNSEYDKFESYLTKEDESKFIQNKVNCESTMEEIERLYGPFSEEEMNHYRRQLISNGRLDKNDFQHRLITLLFLPRFGDTIPLKSINRDDYIKLMIAAKKFLLINGFYQLPAIMSSKLLRLVVRKSINRKELNKLESSSQYELLSTMYGENLQKEILSIIATALASTFQIIDYDIPEIDGLKLEIIPEMILDEIINYILLVCSLHPQEPNRVLEYSTINEQGVYCPRAFNEYNIIPEEVSNGVSIPLINKYYSNKGGYP